MICPQLRLQPSMLLSSLSRLNSCESVLFQILSCSKFETSDEVKTKTHFVVVIVLVRPDILL